MGRDVVVTAVRTRREMLDFIKFPRRVYTRNPHWVPPLLFVQDGADLRRAAAVSGRRRVEIVCAA